jgi:hypothetical protein
MGGVQSTARLAKDMGSLTACWQRATLLLRQPADSAGKGQKAKTKPQTKLLT